MPPASQNNMLSSIIRRYRLNFVALSVSMFLGVAGSLLASFLFPATRNFVMANLVKAFGWVPWRRKIFLGGKWTARWEVESSRYPPSIEDSNAIVRQLGSRFYAKFKAGELDCYLIGTIDSGRYITGVWHDENQGGYHGAFQFVIDPASTNFRGMWIGFSMAGQVKSGSWDWHRNDQPTTINGNKDGGTP